MVFRGGGGEGAVARIFLSTTLNVPWNDAATLATTRFCRRENSRLGYRYTGDPLSCRMSRWKMRLLFGWTHLEEKRNRSPFHDFTIRDIEISTDKSDKPRLTKFFSTSRFGERSKRYNSENLENLRGIRRIYWLLFINIFFWFRFDKRLSWFIYALAICACIFRDVFRSKRSSKYLAKQNSTPPRSVFYYNNKRRVIYARRNAHKLWENSRIQDVWWKTWLIFEFHVRMLEQYSSFSFRPWKRIAVDC